MPSINRRSLPPGTAPVDFALGIGVRRVKKVVVYVGDTALVAFLGRRHGIPRCENFDVFEAFVGMSGGNVRAGTVLRSGQAAGIGFPAAPRRVGMAQR